jgi:hypothetical protein
MQFRDLAGAVMKLVEAADDPADHETGFFDHLTGPDDYAVAFGADLAAGQREDRAGFLVGQLGTRA